MSYGTWLAWAVLMILQTAGFTWLTRARVAESMREHATAIIANRIVTFFAWLLGMDQALQILKFHELWRGAATLALLVACDLVGGLGAQKVLVNLLEKRNRKGTNDARKSTGS